MAKKSFLPTASLDSALNNVEKAGKKKEETTEQNNTPTTKTVTVPESTPSVSPVSPLPAPVVEVVERSRLKIERYANRPKLTNIHIDYDMEDKLNDVKKILNRGKKTTEKTTLDDIIYNAIVEWMNNHYKEIVG